MTVGDPKTVVTRSLRLKLPTQICGNSSTLLPTCEKNYDFKTGGSSIQGGIHVVNTSVSLNGTLYWVASYEMYLNELFILSFDFSREVFKAFTNLPRKAKILKNSPFLAVYKGDRFSVLEQCSETWKIEIWVTKNKINSWDGEDVVWIKLIEVSSPNLPDLVQTGSYSQPSYFIDYKRFVVCSSDETGRAWIYVFGENKLINKIYSL